MPRKGENIYKRKDGRWEGRYIKGRRPDGTTLYGSIYGKKYSDVRDRLMPLKIEYSNRKMMVQACFHGTVDVWLTFWLENIVRNKVKPATYASYRHKLEAYVLPWMGTMQLEKITQENMNELVETLQAQGFQITTIATVLRILHSAMACAVEKNYLLFNPCTGIRLALPPRGAVKALSRSDQHLLEQAAMTENGCASAVLGLYTGLRIGEISALKWSDIDFERNELVVQRTMQRLSNYDDSKEKSRIVIGPPKSNNSLRVIPLAPRLRAYLEQLHQQAQGEYVVNCRGSFAEPRVIAYRFSKLMAQAGLEPVNFHCLRHTFATRCLENNVDVATLSYLLGHSSIKMTLDTYTGSMPEQRRAAMMQIDRLLPGDKTAETVLQGDTRNLMELLKQIFYRTDLAG